MLVLALDADAASASWSPTFFALNAITPRMPFTDVYKYIRQQAGQSGKKLMGYRYWIVVSSSYIVFTLGGNGGLSIKVIYIEWDWLWS